MILKIVHLLLSFAFVFYSIYKCYLKIFVIFILLCLLFSTVAGVAYHHWKGRENLFKSLFKTSWGGGGSLKGESDQCSIESLKDWTRDMSFQCWHRNIYSRQGHTEDLIKYTEHTTTAIISCHAINLNLKSTKKNTQVLPIIWQTHRSTCTTCSLFLWWKDWMYNIHIQFWFMKYAPSFAFL